MLRSVKAKGLSRLVLILNMLEILCENVDPDRISSTPSLHLSSKEEIDRLNKIYNYALANYKNDLTLEEIASVANLSVTSFCRYFKLMTKKTFHDFLIEIRISHAQRMLIEDRLATAEVICFECGFNNRSIFFGHFKKITGLTPHEYKRKCHPSYGF